MPYFQAFTSTAAPVGAISASVEAALDALESEAPGGAVGLVLSTRPDCLDADKADAIAAYAARGLEVWVELGLQSANDATLARLRRGHGLAEFAAARRLLEGRGLRAAVHLILGLPGEDRARMLDTIRVVAGLGLEGVKFHDLHLARGSGLAAEYPAGELTLLHPRRLPALLADCLELVPADCEVIRLCSDPRRRARRPAAARGQDLALRRGRSRA